MESRVSPWLLYVAARPFQGRLQLQRVLRVGAPIRQQEACHGVALSLLLCDHIARLNFDALRPSKLMLDPASCQAGGGFDGRGAATCLQLKPGLDFDVGSILEAQTAPPEHLLISMFDS